MNPELIAEFDSAVLSLDALSAVAVEPKVSIESRLSRDIADSRVHGLDHDSWHTRWIHGPLRAIRVVEGLRLKLMVEQEEVRLDLREVEAELSLLREAGRIADAEFASRKAVRLLCHEADVKERLDAPVAHRITSARNGIARILEVSLRHAGREVLRMARESAQPGTDPATAQEAHDRAEAYNRLVAEAHRITGGVDVPVFLPDHVARLRTLAGAGSARAAGPDAAEASAAMPTVRVPVITKELLASRAAAKPPAPPVRPAPSPRGAAVAPPAPPAGPAPVRGPDAPKTKPSLPRLRRAIARA